MSKAPGQTSTQHSHCKRKGKISAQSVGSMWALATEVLLPCMPPPVTASSSNQCHHLSQEALNTVTSSQLRCSRNVTWRKLYTQKGLPKVGVLMSTLGLVAVIMAGSMFMTQGQVKAHQKKNCICVEQEQISLLVIDALTNAVHISLASIGVPSAIINVVQRGFRVCKRMGMGPMQTLYHFIQRSDASRYLRRVLEPKAHKDNCVHIHIYLYKHTHIYILIYSLFLCLYMLHICIYSYIYIYTSYIFICIQISVFISVFLYVGAYMFPYVHVYNSIGTLFIYYNSLQLSTGIHRYVTKKAFP